MRESERRAEYPQQRTAHFEYIANIKANRASVITQEKKNGSEKDHQENPYD